MDIKRSAWKFERWKAFSWDFHCEALSKFVEIPKNHCFLGNVLKCKSLYKANPSASIKFKSKMAFIMLIWNANPLSIRMHIKYHSQFPHHCRIHTHTHTHFVYRCSFELLEKLHLILLAYDAKFFGKRWSHIDKTSLLMHKVCA